MATATRKKVPPAPADPLDTFIKAANEGPEALMLMLWLERFRNPAFTVEVHPKDLQGFYQCVEYLGVKPQIQVIRPGGAPAIDARPAMGNRKAVPGRAAIPPKNYVIIQMVDQDGNAFVPVENNEQDRDRQIQTEAARRAKDNAITIANALRVDVQSGQFSTGNLNDAINALITLANQT